MGVIAMFEQSGDDASPEEPGTAGNDIAHGSSLIADHPAVNGHLRTR
jgi:hypothetical protein